MKRHTVKHNPKGRNRYSLQALTHAIIQEPTAQRVIEQVRDEFDLLDPIERADREENLAHDREPKNPLEARSFAEMLRDAILRKYGYPPDLQKAATDIVLDQAEQLCEHWVTQ